ncbi:MFS transporter [Bizionia arctica]|uniref:MFS transporter n=1 Tax=Bizionia arctica TaxID=1495645 RepID=A0A917GKQ4_9FLAO|nr:MFS transporter [Bizionia arctica]GGG49481.1 MFS transporter [Bizionia arctica]
MKFTTFNSLKSRNFRLYFVGQSISLIGTWMQKTAVSWVVYSLTQSNIMLGISVFATLFPTAIFSLFGGIVADKYNKYKVLLITQIAALIQAVLLTFAVVFFKQDSVWFIIGLSVVLGIINGYGSPARQALVKDLVEDSKNLPNALALNSSMVNFSKLIGPTIAGFILQQFGDQICFGLNAVSYLTVIISLLLMKLPVFIPKAKISRDIDDLKEGFQYLKKSELLSSVIIFTAFAGFFVLPFTTLTPIFAQNIFKGNASTLGFIDGSIGLGAFLGALYLASLKPGTNLNKILTINTFIFGVGLISFSLMDTLPIALTFLIIGSFGMMSIRTLTNTILQINVEEAFRGRVISDFLLVLASAIPLGSLMVSSISHYIGVQKMVFIEGCIAIIISIFYYIYLKKKRVKHIKINKSIHTTAVTTVQT